MGWWNFTTGVTPNVQIDGTLTVGADGTGYDVIFYGGTASNSLTWDASENVLNILSTMKAADDVFNITVTDATTLSSGYGRGAYIGYTVSGTKTGSYAINGLGIDMTVSEACPTVSALEIYTAAISNKTVGNLYPFSIYCEDIGTAVSNFMALDIGINSTNLASSRHTGIRIRNHAGTAKSAILIEEAFTDTILRHSPSGVDLNLITLDNSSGAKFYWDDSEVKFRFNKGIYADTNLRVVGTSALDGAVTLGSTLALGGTVDASGHMLNNVYTIRSRAGNNILTILARKAFANQGVALYLQTHNASDVPSNRITFTGGYDESTAACANLIWTGIKLGGALDANSQDINNVAAPGAAGDPLIKGTRVTTAELPAMTDEKIWKGTGTDVEEVDWPDLAGHVAAADPHTGYMLESIIDAAGDIIYGSGDNTIARLAKGSDGEVLTLASGLPSWAAAAGDGATKEFFVPVTVGPSDVLTAKGSYPGADLDAGAEKAFIGFYVPADFTSITDAVVARIANATATHRFTYTTEFGALGEGSVTHTATLANEDTAETNTLIYEQDISTQLAGLAAGDYVGIKVYAEATNPPNDHILGVRFKYS